MAQGVDSRELAKGSPYVGIDAIAERLWHFLTSMRFAVALILVLAALGVVGSLLVQVPGGIAADPTARANWLIQVRPKYGGWTGLFDSLQFLDIFNSIYFRVTVMLLAISTVACSAHRIPGVWRTATKPRVDLDGTFFAAAPTHASAELDGDAAASTAAIRTILRRHRYRTVVHEDDVVHIYADRNRWSPVGSLAGHLALVVILAGAIVGNTFGFRDPSFMITEGTTAAVPSNAGLSIKLVSFKDSYYTDTGEPSDYASDLIVYRDGAQVASQTVRVNQPLRFGDMSFYQSRYGPAALVTVTDAAGKPLTSEGVPLAWQAPDGERSMGTLTLAEQGLIAYVIGTTGPDDALVKPGQMHLELYSTSDDGGTPVAIDTITQGEPKVVDGLTFLFDRETQFTSLSIVRDPGAPLVWLGGLMLVLGIVAVLMFPHRRMWGRLVARPDGGSSLAFASVGRHDSNFEAEFARLVNEVREAAAAPQRG